jgi:hypothetical protein
MKHARAIVLGLVILSVLGLSHCARDQQLVSIAVTPQDSTITGAGLELQYTAIGTYIHPPETKDITSTVVWKSEADQIISFSTPDKPGLATSGLGCGTNLGISATMYSNPQDPSAGTAVVGNATVTVKQVDNPNCPP